MFSKIIFKSCVCVFLLTIASCSDEDKTKEQAIIQETSTVEKTAEEAVTVDKTAEEAVTAEPAAESESQEEPTAESSEVLVRLGDEELTMEQVKWIYPDADEVQISKFAKWWLENALLSEEAERQGLTEQPDIIYRTNLGKKRVLSQLLLQRLQKVTSEEVLSYYEENKDSNRLILVPGRMNLSHIKTETLEEAEAVLQRIKAGEDFNELAKKLSLAKSKEKGGKLQRQSYNAVKSRFGQELFDALVAVNPGHIEGPTKVKNGYEIIRLEGKKEPKAKPFKEVEARLKIMLQQQKKQNVAVDLLKQLKEQAADRIVKSPVLLQMEKLAEQAAKPPIKPPLKPPVKKP